MAPKQTKNSFHERWGFLHHWQSANGPLEFRAFWTDQNGIFVLKKNYSKHLQTESPKVACLIFFWGENRVFEHIILVNIEFNCLQGPPHVTCKTFRLAIFRRNGSILWTFQSQKVCQVYPCSPKKGHGIWIKTTKNLVILVYVERFGFVGCRRRCIPKSMTGHQVVYCLWLT